MLVHANPMIRLNDKHWRDANLRRVEVKTFMVNWGNHRRRWGVYMRRPGGPLMVTSRHITEEQAVVSAQTLANRLYRLSKQAKKKKASPSLEAKKIIVSSDDRTKMLADLDATLEYTESGHSDIARSRAQDLVKRISRIFDLRASGQGVSL